MPFDHDTKESLDAAAWLVNSAGSPDGLQQIEDLERFLKENDYTGRFDRTQEELQSVKDSRRMLREILTASRDEAPELINAVLRKNIAIPQVVRHGSRDWHIHAVEPDAPLASRLLVETAFAMSAVVIADERSRIRTCAALNCTNVVIDLTRNRSRRFCGTACSNRTAVAAYRTRQKPMVDTPDPGNDVKINPSGG